MWMQVYFVDIEGVDVKKRTWCQVCTDAYSCDSEQCINRVLYNDDTDTED